MKKKVLIKKLFMIALSFSLFTACSKEKIVEPSNVRDRIDTLINDKIEPVKKNEISTPIFHDYYVIYNKERNETRIEVKLKERDKNGILFYRTKLLNVKVKVNNQEEHNIANSAIGIYARYARYLWVFKNKVDASILFQEKNGKTYTNLADLNNLPDVSFEDSFLVLSKSNPQFKWKGTESNDTQIEYRIAADHDLMPTTYGLVTNIKSKLIDIPQQNLQPYNVGDKVNIFLTRYKLKHLKDSDGKVCGVVRMEITIRKNVKIVA